MIENLQVLEIEGQRVLTTKQIAEAYGTTSDVIGYNFRYNKNRYIEGKHFISLEGEELRHLKDTTIEFQRSLMRVKKLYFWTEKGALLHAKSLNTDKAWEVYDYLVDFYFRAKETPSEEIQPVKVTETESLPEQRVDIAPLFRELIEMLPLESLDEMEKCFRSGISRAIKSASLAILAEKMKRQLE